MHEDSPPPFIVIRTPLAVAQPRVTLYQRGLEIVGLISEIIQKASARFYLKDRLDRAATSVVFALGRAADAPNGKWKDYRAAHGHATAVATLLDILAHQKAAPADLVERAQRTVRDLLADVSRHTNG